ncbi:hypothetical protein Tco_0422241 [Tanacetum coccineum]
MVGTINTSLEVQVDATIRNWVENHVTSIATPLIEKIKSLNTTISNLMVANQYNNRGEGSSRFSRMSKLDFPKFSDDDVKGWMFRIKQFFTLDGVHNANRVKIVSIHLFDQALTWHLQFIKTHGEIVAWDVYEAAILKRPMSLTDAFSLACLQEATLAVIKQRNAPLLHTPKTASVVVGKRGIGGSLEFIVGGVLGCEGFIVHWGLSQLIDGRVDGGIDGEECGRDGFKAHGAVYRGEDLGAVWNTRLRNYMERDEGSLEDRYFRLLTALPVQLYAL